MSESPHNSKANQMNLRSNQVEGKIVFKISLSKITRRILTPLVSQLSFHIVCIHPGLSSEITTRKLDIFFLIGAILVDDYRTWGYVQRTVFKHYRNLRPPSFYINVQQLIRYISKFQIWQHLLQCLIVTFNELPKLDGRLRWQVTGYVKDKFDLFINH